MSHDVMLGEIQWLEDIRGIWTDEAASFTPWLLDNAHLLGAALGIDIELERAEHPVGGFRLDLIGRDRANDTLLIVENQIEQSDHGHLGQLLTYAAGTDAATIVWIARSFREEHRNALDWLNEHTGEDVRFFGVAIRLLRVGESQPAPFFDVVAKPNDWQKSVRTTAQAQQVAADERFVAFWRPLFEQFLAEHAGLIGQRRAPRSLWFPINSPISQTSLYGEVGSEAWRIVLDIDTGVRDSNVALLEQLSAFTDRINAIVPGAFFNPGKVRARVVWQMPSVGKAIEDSASFDEARAWFSSNLVAAHGVLAEIALLLDPVP